jgi:sugar phosphate isomerase/epimerase
MDEAVLIGGRAHSVEDVEFIAKAGFPFVEISIRSIREFRSDLNSLKRIQAEYGIFYLAHGPEEDNPWKPEALRKNFLPLIKSLLGCAAELSISLFTVHFWIDRRFVDEGVANEKLKILEDMSICAREHDITLCIENLSESFSHFSPAFAAIESLGMTLDIGHGELLTKINTAYDFTLHCFPRIQHLHLHDNRGGDSPKDDLHLPLGEGIVDVCSILSRLKAQGYDRTMTLEVQPSQLLSGKKIIEKIWYEPLFSAEGTVA